MRPAAGEPADRALRAIGHHLRPVVTIGDRGLTDAVADEADAALARHELIKVKLPAGTRHERGETAAALAERCAARCVQLIGRTALLFRKAPDAGATSNLRRHAHLLGGG